MRDVSAALLDFLQSGTEFVVAELWKITPAGKSALYFTSAQEAFSYGGQTYNSLDIEREDIEDASGLQVSTLDFSVYAPEDAVLDSLTWPEAAINGYFDGAAVELRLLFLFDWATQVGAVLLFTGTVSDVDVHLGKIKFTAKSLMEVFNQLFPRNLYQSTCPFLLYDANCGVLAASFAVAGAVAADSDADTILDASLTQADDYFAFGYVEFTSGDLSGQRRTVESSESGRLDLATPFPQDPEVGDAFNVYPGCDRTKATCEAKFSNTNFGGTSFIPQPEVLY